MALAAVLRKVRSFRVPLVEVTGGEPLEQEGALPLMTALVRAGYAVMLETNGAHDVSRVPRAVLKVVDVKCPSSGREGANHWPNLRRLGTDDEVKFVVADRRDYRYARRVMRRFRLSGRHVLLSPVHGLLPARRLAGWVLKDRLDARVQVQLHKVLWGPGARRR
jgi:7-carboxy-7-deazaguanine synthase